MVEDSEHLHCALCDSKILDDDSKTSCKRCGKYMCNYCISSTDRCCADDQPPVLTPVGDSYVCREVEEISLKAVALAFLLLVLPFFSCWLHFEKHEFMRSHLNEAEYEEWQKQDDLRMMSMIHN